MLRVVTPLTSIQNSFSFSQDLKENKKKDDTQKTVDSCDFQQILEKEKEKLR